MKRSVFFISDGTGITAETLGHSLLSQFEEIRFEETTLPYIDTVEKAITAQQEINRAAEADGVRPIIIDTIVDKSIRAVIAEANGYMMDVFDTFVDKLQAELAKLSVAARVGTLDALKPAVSSVAGTCKNCHDNFRQ